MNLLYKLWYLFNEPKLGAIDLYPMPTWLRKYLSKYPLHVQVVKYARTLNGVDLSYIAPDLFGCAESVTRLLKTLDRDLIDIITYTPDLKKFMDGSDRFIEIPEHVARAIGGGFIGIAPTVPRIMTGHTWVHDYDGWVMENNSYGKDWGKYRTWEEVKEYYKKLDIHYYLPI